MYFEVSVATFVDFEQHFSNFLALKRATFQDFMSTICQGLMSTPVLLLILYSRGYPRELADYKLTFIPVDFFPLPNKVCRVLSQLQAQITFAYLSSVISVFLCTEKREHKISLDSLSSNTQLLQQMRLK